MAKRLQVILEDQEFLDIQRSARSRHVPVAEWVRQALRMARRREASREVDKKLSAIRAAARFNFPAGDIDQMLKEIGPK